MFEILKSFNDSTDLVYNNGQVYICKKINADDLPLYKKLIQLKNKNVAQVYETVVINNHICAISEFVQGTTLAEYISSHGAMDDVTATDYALQLCNGLNAIHSLDIVHRDINPNNIIITDKGVLKIIDFGISRIIKPNRTNDTQLLGTREYAAPEQYGFCQTSNRADIYSFGVVLNYMLTGCTTQQRVTTASLATVVNKCTQMDQNNRYSNVDEIIADLAKKNRFIRHLRNIPGFRRGKWWHILIAVLYYYCVGIILIASLTIDDNVRMSIMYFLYMFFTFVPPVPLLTNYRGWASKWKATRNLPLKSRIFVQFLLAGCSELIALLIIILI